MESRRTFVKKATGFALTTGLFGLSSCSNLMEEQLALELPVQDEDLFFTISLAEWSIRKSLWSGKNDHLDFARVAKEVYNIKAIEYVNQFFFDKATDTAYLTEMNKRADDQGVKQVLIMIDMEGSLATLDEKNRKASVDKHYKWIDAAKFLGCHSIRVNAAGKGDRNAVANAAVDSLGTLAEYGARENINVIVENHGGYSSDANWLVNVMKQVNMNNCGVLPDFGNFTMSLWPPSYYDTYKGIEELMPFAKGVSAKSHDFDKDGNDVKVDFQKAIDIVRKSGFNGFVDIEYEGYKLSEEAGIKATRHLLSRVGKK